MPTSQPQPRPARPSPEPARSAGDPQSQPSLTCQAPQRRLLTQVLPEGPAPPGRGQGHCPAPAPTALSPDSAVVEKFTTGPARPPLPPGET